MSLVRWDSIRVLKEMEPALNVLPSEPLLILEQQVQLVVVSSAVVRELQSYVIPFPSNPEPNEKGKCGKSSTNYRFLNDLFEMLLLLWI